MKLSSFDICNMQSDIASIVGVTSDSKISFGEAGSIISAVRSLDTSFGPYGLIREADCNPSKLKLRSRQFF